MFAQLQELNLLYISEIIGYKGKVYAYDNNEQRIKTAKSDLSRNGLNNIIWEKKKMPKQIFIQLQKNLSRCSLHWNWRNW